MPEAVSKQEAVRQAVAELGEAPPQEIAAFVQAKFALQVQAQFVPVLLASLRGQEQLERSRQAARQALAQARAEEQVKAKPPRKKPASPKPPDGVSC
jgi:hypothetical protein